MLARAANTADVGDRLRRDDGRRALMSPVTGELSGYLIPILVEGRSAARDDHVSARRRIARIRAAHSRSPARSPAPRSWRPSPRRPAYRRRAGADRDPVGGLARSAITSIKQTQGRAAEPRSSALEEDPPSRLELVSERCVKFCARRRPGDDLAATRPAMPHRARRRPRAVSSSVTDSGIGISRDQVAEIFETVLSGRFVVDAGVRRYGPLGLTLAKAYVRSALAGGSGSSTTPGLGRWKRSSRRSRSVSPRYAQILHLHLGRGIWLIELSELTSRFIAMLRVIALWRF